MFARPVKKQGPVSRAAERGMIGLVRAVFALARTLGPERSSSFGGMLARRIGPLLPQHRVALSNVRAAFPDKSEDDIRAIVLGAWENIGRTGAEYAHLGALFDQEGALEMLRTAFPDKSEDDIRAIVLGAWKEMDRTDAGYAPLGALFKPEHSAKTAGRIEVDGLEHFLALMSDNKPGIIFAAHLANWELPAICAARYGLDATAVFRPPNSPAAAHIVHEIRSQTMGGLEAARSGAVFAMQGVLERGGHLGALIDQHFSRGVLVEFFGRPALVNPVLGMLARQYECPVHGTRVIRLPNCRFRMQLTPPLDLPRDPDGRINVQGAMQAMTRVVEVWVREHPEQWLWQHRRWRVVLTPIPS